MLWDKSHTERTSLPAPQARVHATRRKWGASPAAFRDRRRGACVLCLAPGKGDTGKGWGGGGGCKCERKMRKREMKLLKTIFKKERPVPLRGGEGEQEARQERVESLSRNLPGCRGYVVTLFRLLMNTVDLPVDVRFTLISLGPELTVTPEPPVDPNTL